MPAAAVGFAVVAAVAAVVNWWSRVADDARAERWSKPLTLLALIGVAATIDAADPAVRAWFLVALVLSLAGDVLLLDDRRFVAGLAAFLLAHVAYTVGFVVAPDWSWPGLVVGAVVMAAVGGVVGAPIVRGARQSSASLAPPVVLYLVAISAMAACAVAAGNVVAIVGAALFVSSDAILGWRQFVDARPWMSPAVMVTYHLGQAGLVASLL